MRFGRGTKRARQTAQIAFSLRDDKRKYGMKMSNKMRFETSLCFSCESRKAERKNGRRSSHEATVTVPSPVGRSDQMALV